MACEKEMACCVRGYHVYKDILAAAIGEVLACSREPTNAEKFHRKKYIRVKYFRPFVFVRKYFYNEIKADYGSLLWSLSVTTVGYFLVTNCPHFISQ